MAGSLNQVTLIGHLGQDPEIRRTQGGNAVANFSIATTETWRDRNSGERKEKTDWHSVVVWNEGLAKICEQYLRKGSKVYVQGKLQTRKWQHQDGSDRYTTEVVLQFDAKLIMLSGRDENGGGDSRRDDRGSSRGNGSGGGRSNGRGANDDYGSGSYGGGGSGGGFSRELDDDIPFEMPWR
ncbi:single-stranded DNA-binding protein [Rhizobium sp. NLR4b]|uniref:single-stranded DNA-binding protein n=1 Tax=Rhizobium sp. NLR4b TaxID=2731118 RepID=UPI001C832DD4|nr:single-stranded DNA-binding protein [Rhizobium sp. NLR4b]MBX5253378.1 single-stranded DNA-binding protein [Rhizobium sp. NLR4b]